MSKPVLIAAAVAAALAVTPAKAASPSRPPAAPAGIDPESQAEMRRLADWSQDLRTAMVAFAVSLHEVLKGAGTLQDLHHGHDSAAAGAWAAQWTPARRSELAALKARLAGLRTSPPVTPSDARLQEMMGRYRNYGEAVARVMAETGTLEDELLGLIEQAAAGSETAYVRLQVRMWDGTVQATRAELATVELGGEIAGPGHPQTDSTQVLAAVEKGLIAVYSVRRNLAAGDPPGTEACAAELSSQAEAAEEAAGRIDADADRMIAKVHANGGTAEMLRRMDTTFGTYHQSSAIARRIAAAMRDLGDVLKSGRTLDSAEVSTALNTLVERTREFQALDQTRAQILSGR